MRASEGKSELHPRRRLRLWGTALRRPRPPKRELESDESLSPEEAMARRVGFEEHGEDHRLPTAPRAPLLPSTLPAEATKNHHPGRMTSPSSRGKPGSAKGRRGWWSSSSSSCEQHEEGGVKKTARPTVEKAEAAARGVVYSRHDGEPGRQAAEWAAAVFGGAAPFATRLEEAESGEWVRLCLENTDGLEGEIATRSRLGMSWYLDACVTLRASGSTADRVKLEVSGLGLRPIEGAGRAFRGLLKQWVEDGVVRDAKHPTVEAHPKDFLDSAWRWWKRAHESLAGTKYWRVVESLVGKQAIRSVTPTADLALVVVGCACGCPWRIQAVVFDSPNHGGTSPVSSPTTPSRLSHLRAGFLGSPRQRQKRQASRESTEEPTVPWWGAVSSSSVDAQQSTSPGSGVSTSSPLTGAAPSTEAWFQYEPVQALSPPQEQEHDDATRAFKVALIDTILRASYASNVTVRLSRKFAASAFHFSLAWFDLADLGLPRADPATLTRMIRASDVVGGATNADRLRGALHWQKDDPTYRMTGPLGRVLWRRAHRTTTKLTSGEENTHRGGPTRSSDAPDEAATRLAAAFSSSSEDSTHFDPVTPEDLHKLDPTLLRDDMINALFEPAFDSVYAEASGTTTTPKSVSSWIVPEYLIIPSCM